MNTLCFCFTKIYGSNPHEASFISQMILPVAVEDVKREVNILKALKGHENVVHFRNAFEDDSYVYIVME